MTLNWKRITHFSGLLILIYFGILIWGDQVFAEDASQIAIGGIVWWVWPIILFVFSFVLGILAIAAGVGGGVLFVPIVSSFFPFSLDFVRGAGLLVALSGALSAGSHLLKRGLANLRLAIPMALIASISSILGARVGLALPTNIVQISLGGTIIIIVVIMLLAKKSEYPHVEKADALSSALQISGVYYEESANKNIDWKIHRTPLGFFLFVLIGFMAGMFGLGAGWANVPVLNLVLGAPLKISVASSVFILSISDTSAAWVYINNGAILPIIVVPSVIGVMMGTKIGAKVLTKAKPKMIKWTVIVFLFLAGFRALLKGTGIWE